MEENSNFQLRIEASRLLVLSDTVFQKWSIRLYNNSSDIRKSYRIGVNVVPVCRGKWRGCITHGKEPRDTSGVLCMYVANKTSFKKQSV